MQSVLFWEINPVTGMSLEENRQEEIFSAQMETSANKDDDAGGNDRMPTLYSKA